MGDINMEVKLTADDVRAAAKQIVFETIKTALANAYIKGSFVTINISEYTEEMQEFALSILTEFRVHTANSHYIMVSAPGHVPSDSEARTISVYEMFCKTEMPQN